MALPLGSSPGLGLPHLFKRRWVRPVLLKLTEPQNHLPEKFQGSPTFTSDESGLVRAELCDGKGESSPIGQLLAALGLL